MKDLLILLAFAFLVLKPASSAAQDNRDENPAKRAGCVLRMDFGSPGSGIDIKAYSQVKKIFDDRKLAYKEVNTGREGELYFCLQLKELNRKKKKALIKELKKIAETGQLVSVSNT